MEDMCSHISCIVIHYLSYLCVLLLSGGGASSRM